MGSHLHIPEEVISNVVQFLELPTDHEIAEARHLGSGLDQHVKILLKTLSSLCRSSRALQRIAEPMLYKTFPGHRLVNTRLYVAALQARPQRCWSVQELVIDRYTQARERPLTYDEYLKIKAHAREAGPSCPAPNYDDPFLRGLDFAQDSERLSAEDIENWKRQDEQVHPQVFDPPFDGPLEDAYIDGLPRFRSIVLDCVVPCSFRKHALEQLDAGHQDAVFALLLMMCPNLRSLDLSTPEEMYSTIMYRALFYAPYGCMCDPEFAHRVILKHQKRLQNLRSLTVRRLPGAISKAFPARDMPSLKNLDIRNGDMTMAARDHSARGNPPCRLLESLNLRDVKIDAASLEYIPRSNPVLRSLSIEISPNNGPVDRMALGEALRNHIPDLTDFSFDTRANNCHMHHTTWEEGLYGELGSLRDVAKLRSLTATPKLLLCSASTVGEEPCCSLQDVLPVNLRELTLLGSLEVTPVPVVDLHTLRQVKVLLDRGLPLLDCIRIQGSRASINKLYHSDWHRSIEICERNRDRIYYTYRRKTGASRTE